MWKVNCFQVFLCILGLNRDDQAIAVVCVSFVFFLLHYFPLCVFWASGTMLDPAARDRWKRHDSQGPPCLKKTHPMFSDVYEQRLWEFEVGLVLGQSK